jgi:hypothetical protein
MRGSSLHAAPWPLWHGVFYQSRSHGFAGERLSEAEATDTIPANTFQADSADSPALGTLKGAPVAIGNGPKKSDACAAR